MNKKGFIGFLLGFLVVLLLISLISISNPQKTFMVDCKSSYTEDFRIINSTCLRGNLQDFINNSLKEKPCLKVDYNSLNKYCLNKYVGLKQ